MVPLRQAENFIMATGLQIFRPNGDVQLDMTMRVAKFIGIANKSGSKNGVETLTGVRSGEQMWFVPTLSTAATTLTAPTLTLSGMTITWHWPGAYPGSPILYGVM